MHLEMIILSEVNQKEKDKKKRERQMLYDIAYMWNLKYDTSELNYERETD